MEKRPTLDLAAVEDILHDGQLAHNRSIASPLTRYAPTTPTDGNRSARLTIGSRQVRKQQIVGLQNLTILCFICDNSKPSLVVISLPSL